MIRLEESRKTRGYIRVTAEHSAQAHARPQVPHELYSIELLEPYPIIENILLPARLWREVVLDAQALDVGPKFVELLPYALDVHSLHVCALSRTSSRSSRGISNLHGAST